MNGYFLGLTNSDSEYIHLSDGGHFENLGIYELLRRRCRYVVAVDAPEDDSATSGNLGNLVSKARIDLGIRIHIDTAPLKLEGPQHYSRTHVVIGQILYDDVQRNATPGILVYIRASMTGDEPPDVQQYRNNHEHFPYESTVNQSFGEEQFESYRALGFHIAVNVFEDAASELQGWLQEDRTKDLAKSSPEDVARRAHARLFAALHSRWIHQPTGDGKWYADSVRSFVELQRDLRDKSELSVFARELYPELGDDSPSTTKKDDSPSTTKKDDSPSTTKEARQRAALARRDSPARRECVAGPGPGPTAGRQYRQGLDEHAQTAHRHSLFSSFLAPTPRSVQSRFPEVLRTTLAARRGRAAAGTADAWPDR
jgi:hypothetical protein